GVALPRAVERLVDSRDVEAVRLARAKESVGPFGTYYQNRSPPPGAPSRGGRHDSEQGRSRCRGLVGRSGRRSASGDPLEPGLPLADLRFRLLRGLLSPLVFSSAGM